MDKRISVRIYPDGRVQAQTIGIKGRSCCNYIRVLEEMLDAETYLSSYTAEYYEEQKVNLDIQKDQLIEGVNK